MFNKTLDSSVSDWLFARQKKLQFLARGRLFLLSTMPRANQLMQPHIHWIIMAEVAQG
jgi:hypothetical protein